MSSKTRGICKPQPFSSFPIYIMAFDQPLKIQLSEAGKFGKFVVLKDTLLLTCWYLHKSMLGLKIIFLDPINAIKTHGYVMLTWMITNIHLKVTPNTQLGGGEESHLNGQELALLFCWYPPLVFQFHLLNKGTNGLCSLL